MFWERFKILCTEKGISPNRAAKDMGFSSASVTYWSRGSQPSAQNLAKIAEYFGTSVGYLSGYVPPPIAQRISGIASMPIVGDVKAGFDGVAIEDFSGGYMSVTSESLRGYDVSECRLLKVRGDSMYPIISDGDIVLCHIQPDVDNGQIAVIFTEDSSATIKQVYKHDDCIELIPKNPEYKPRILHDGDDVRIWGRVLRLMRDF